LVPPHSAASQAQCEDGGRRYENGDIIVRGINATNFIAGRLVICDGMELRAVCAASFGDMAVKVVCQQLGFDRGR
jgi:hypothetical protein